MAKTAAANAEQSNAMKKRAKQAKRNQPERQWLAELEGRVDRLEIGNRLSRSVCGTLAQTAGKHALQIRALEQRAPTVVEVLFTEWSRTIVGRLRWLLLGR